MKKRMMACGLLLLMVLSLFSGCKQVDAAGEAAAPSEEVVNAPVTEKPEQKEEEPVESKTDEPMQDNSNTEQYIDYFDCNYRLYLRDEYVGQYTLEDFPEIEATELIAYDDVGDNEPNIYILNADYSTKQQVTDTFLKLMDRKEFYNCQLTYTAYAVKEGDTEPQLPSLERPKYSGKQMTLDGMIEVHLEYEAEGARIFAVSDFPGLSVEAIMDTVTFYSYNAPIQKGSIAVYLKETGKDALNHAIQEVQKFDFVKSAELYKERNETID